MIFIVNGSRYLIDYSSINLKQLLLLLLLCVVVVVVVVVVVFRGFETAGAMSG
jgi:hypothetical protein